MNGSSILLDTNIILYYLSGDKALTTLLEENKLYVSIITEIELLGFHKISEQELQSLKAFLNFCTVVNISDQVKAETINIRRNEKLKLPDALIIATSRVMEIPFLTADQDFTQIKDERIIYYER